MQIRIKTKAEKENELKLWHKFFCIKPRKVQSDIDSRTYLVFLKRIYRRLHKEEGNVFHPAKEWWEYCLDDFNLIKRGAQEEEVIMATGNQNAPYTGQIKFDSNTMQTKIYDGNAWQTIGVRNMYKKRAKKPSK